MTGTTAGGRQPERLAAAVGGGDGPSARPASRIALSTTSSAATRTMSEYQYYEFQAIDRPLDERAMAELRGITSRAEITPTSLVNVYHFGDFKGDPDRLMDKYFDAFLYVANWGTRRLMLRLPRGSLDLAAVKPYTVPDVLEAR